MSVVRCLLALALLLVLCPPLGHAQGVRFQPQSATAAGQGNAFSAQADDPSAIHYNPAGLTQVLGVQAMLGTLLAGGTTTFTSPTGATAVGDRNGSVAWPPPSHAYVTANLGSLGLSSLSGVTAGIGL